MNAGLGSAMGLGGLSRFWEDQSRSSQQGEGAQGAKWVPTTVGLLGSCPELHAGLAAAQSQLGQPCKRQGAVLEGLQGTYAGWPVGIKGCRMPKPHRHVPVHGKHLLLLSPQDAPAATAPKPSSPGQGTEPSAAAPGSRPLLPTPGRELSFYSLARKTTPNQPIPICLGYAGSPGGR